MHSILERQTGCRLVQRFEAMLSQVLESSSKKALRVAVVGGGAGGVELTLALAHRLVTELDAKRRPASQRPIIT